MPPCSAPKRKLAPMQTSKPVSTSVDRAFDQTVTRQQRSLKTERNDFCPENDGVWGACTRDGRHRGRGRRWTPPPPRAASHGGTARRCFHPSPARRPALGRADAARPGGVLGRGIPCCLRQTSMARPPAVSSCAQGIRFYSQKNVIRTEKMTSKSRPKNGNGRTQARRGKPARPAAAAPRQV